MKANRVKSIDLWRLLFIFMIVIAHTNYLFWFWPGNGPEMLQAWNCFDFFFLLSGFVMAKQSEKPLKGTLGEDSWSYILKRIKSFYPMYLLAVVFDLLSRWLLTGYTVEPGSLCFYIWDLLLLRATGLRGTFMLDTAVGGAWYLMTVVLAMTVLYPIMRAKKDVFLHVLAPLLAAFLFGWFSQVYGKANYAMQFDNGVCLGLLRAIAGVCFGCVFYTL